MRGFRERRDIIMNRAQTSVRLQSRLPGYRALLGQTFKAWFDDKGPRLGAALAYYALFSLAPMLLIAVTVAGSVFGDVSAQEEVVKQVGYYVGAQGAQAVRSLMGPVAAAKGGAGAAILSVVLMLFTSSLLVSELQSALNEIWKAEAPPRPWLALVRRQVVALGFVIGSGFLLLLSLISSALVSTLGKYMSSRLPMPETALHAADFIMSFGIVTLLLAMIYKYLPDTRIAWRDVWTGAAATSVLLVLGNLVIGSFLAKRDLTSAFGAAGSLLLVAVWIFYGAQLLYLGAEFTHAHAARRKAEARGR